MAGKIDRELFITNLKKKHGDKVDLIGEYCGKERKVTIIYHCEKHGDTITTLNAKNIFDRNFNPCKECFKESHSGSRHSVKDKQHYYQKLTECCKSHCGYVIETEWTKAMVSLL